jgi:ABC-type multidrug transport system fused ATPase/permease subunit
MKTVRNGKLIVVYEENIKPNFSFFPTIACCLGEGKAVSRVPLIPGAGRIINKDNIIHFEHVPLVTPNGDVLIEDMSFEVHSGMNVLVCGPNGCGKSSLFRVLGEVRKNH